MVCFREWSDFVNMCFEKNLAAQAGHHHLPPLECSLPKVITHYPCPFSSSCHVKHLIKRPPLCGSSNLRNSTTSEYLKKWVQIKNLEAKSVWYGVVLQLVWGITRNIRCGNWVKRTFTIFCHASDLCIGRTQFASGDCEMWVAWDSLCLCATVARTQFSQWWQLYLYLYLHLYFCLYLSLYLCL